MIPRVLGPALALTLALAAPARAADPFYETALRDGVHAYERGDFPTAVRDLRIACFGLLEEPQPLAECLVRLAVARSAAGDARGFEETFRRVVEVEERFGAYGKAVLPADLRAAFEAKVAAAIPAATIESLPAFATIVQRKREAQTAAPPSRQRRKAETAPAPPPVSSGPAGTVPATVEPPGARGASALPAPPPAPPAPAADTEKLARIRQALEEGSSRDLKRALQLARDAAEARPGDAEVQLLAAEVAYRNARWSEAVQFFRRGGDPGDERPELLFYLAVSYFESGDRGAAATVLRRSLPNLKPSPFVDDYKRKILASPGT